MKTAKKLLILTTGGTIASVKTPHGLIPGLDSQELLSYLPSMDTDICLTTKAVCSLDSTDMTPDHWILLANTIRDEYEQYDGFVICHGTDTMAYTAAALSYLIQHSSKPIILTGAQKPIGSEITDAKTNLRDSILYAADSGSHGVQIVFDGKAIIGTRAKKQKPSATQLFPVSIIPSPQRCRMEKSYGFCRLQRMKSPSLFMTGSMQKYSC